jgi:cytochrome c oxidase subunit 2
MFYLYVALAVLAFVILMALVYRIFTLAELAKESSKDGTTRVSRANALNAGLFVVMFFAMFGLIFWYSMDAKQYFLPEAASAHGPEIELPFLSFLPPIVCFSFFLLSIVTRKTKKHFFIRTTTNWS